MSVNIFCRYIILKSITSFVHISERMAEIMEEDKVTIKEEISVYMYCVCNGRRCKRGKDRKSRYGYAFSSHIFFRMIDFAFL